MKVKPLKIWDGCWTVEISQGHQYFSLDYHGEKKEAQWMAKMFRRALRNHDATRVK